MAFTNILVAADGSDDAKRAVTMAADLASKYDATLTALHVVAHPGSPRVPQGLDEYERIEHLHVTERDLLMGAAERLLDEVVNLCAAHDRTVERVVRTGDPATVITEVAREIDADLVVMGSRGLSDFKGLFLGSVSHKVTAACEGAVLIAR